MTNRALILEAIRDLSQRDGDATEESLARYTCIGIPSVRRALFDLERAGAVRLTRETRSSRWPCLGGMPSGDRLRAELVSHPEA